MTRPVDLAAMIETLLAMKRTDRAFVLDQLRPETRRKLLPMLEQAQRTELSTGLRDLVKSVSSDETPAGLTSRGAAALASAVRPEAAIDVVKHERQAGLSLPAQFNRALHALGLRA